MDTIMDVDRRSNHDSQPVSCLSFSIELEPMPAPRAAGRHHRFKTDEYKDYQDLIRDEAKNAVDLFEADDAIWSTTGPFHVILDVTIAKKKWKTAGDPDNYEKGILDACTRVIWHDDRVRYIPLVTKRFKQGEIGRVDVQVIPITVP